MDGNDVAPLLRFGVFEVDLRTGELRKSGVRIHLGPQPFKVLALLAGRPGELVTREDIQREIWGETTFVDYEQSLRVAIKKIRAALSDRSRSPRYVETLSRRGYRFIAPVEAVLPDSSPALANGDHGSAGAVGAMSPMSRPRPSRWLFAAGAATAMALVLIGLNVGRVRGRLAAAFEARSPAPVSGIRSIAVLPLANLSRDSSQDYFADGLTEALTTDLGRIGQLRVISRTSAMHYKDTTETLRQIAHDLNVDAVIEGAVVHSESHLRITVQLVEARSDRQLWADVYEGDVRNAFSLEDKVALDIAEHVRIQLSAEDRSRLANASVIDPAAEEQYFRGRYDSFQWTAPRLKSSVGHFQRAIQIDPHCAQAWSGLAGDYALLGMFGYLPRRTAWMEARAAARRALKLDPSLAEAHVFLAGISWPVGLSSSDSVEPPLQAFSQAGKELRRAIALNPNDAIAHQWLGYHLAAQGHFGRAIAEMKLARELDPLSPNTRNSLGAVYYWAGRYDQALEQFQGVPDGDVNSERRHRRMAWIYERKGMPDQAIAQLLSAARLAHKQTLVESVEREYRAAGYARARRLFLRDDIGETERQWKNRGRRVGAVMVAADYALLGETGRSLQWLEKAVRDQNPGIEFLKVDDRFETLRSDPRFQNLLPRVGLSR